MGKVLRFQKLRWAVFLLAAVMIVMAAGCSKSSSASSPPLTAGSNAASGGSASAPAANAAAAKSGAQAADTAKLAAQGADSAKPAAAQSAAGGSSAPAQAAGGFGAALPESEALNRKLIYTADLGIQTSDYDKSQAEIRNRVNGTGAYILQFNENESAKEKSGSFVIKVPASGFASLLSELEQLDHLHLTRSVKGDDVSEEYVDLTSRLKARQAVEARLLSFMEKADKAEDLVSFSNELGKVQEDIEKIKGRMQYIDQNVAMSTINVRLYQTIGAAAERKLEAEGSVWAQAANAFVSSSKAMGIAGRAVFVFLAGALPVLAVLGIIIFSALLVNRKRRKQEAVLPVPDSKP